MRESSRFERWHRLGRLLPREVRERVYDPALSDLVHEWLRPRHARRRAPFALYAVGTYLGCLPTSSARLFVRRGRLTRLGKVSAWTVTIVAVLVVVLVTLTDGYAAYGP